MANGIDIVIGADVRGALTGLQQVEQRSKQVASSVGNASKGFNTFTTSSNQATLALSNLGRVAQDAPFGFIGIANNLNPLLESFQRLKATTKTTGGALKALAGSLKGPAGIGIALSVASSLLIVFGDKLFGVSKKAKEANEAIKSIASGIAGELVTLTSLVGVIQNVNTSNEDRVKALRAVNEQYGKYLPNLEKEGITAANISKAYDQITDSLLRQAVVKGIQSEIQKEVEEVAAKIINLTKKQQQQRLESEKGNETNFKKISSDKLIQRGQESLTRATTDGFQATVKQNQALQTQIGATNILGQLIESLKGSLKDTLKPLLDLTSSFGDLDIKDVKLKPEKATLAPKKLELDFSSSIFSGNIDIQPPPEFKAVATEFGVMFSKELNEYFKRPDLIDFSLISAVQKDKDSAKAAKQLGDSFTEMLNQALLTGASDSISALAEGFGNVLSGKDFGSSILNAFSGLLAALGKALIEYGLIKEGLDKILGAGGIAIPGVVAIALGAVAIAASTALKNVGGARASGGPVAAGVPYVVGEVGKEIFVPSVSGTIVPNNRIGGYRGGGSQSTGRSRTYIRGNNLVLAMARTNRSQVRLG